MRPIKYKRPIILSKLLAAKEKNLALNSQLTTTNSDKPKMQVLEKFPAFLKYILTKFSCVFAFLSVQPKPFRISLLCAESFVYLIKLSKHRPPTGCLLLPEILKLSATVLP